MRNRYVDYTHLRRRRLSPAEFGDLLTAPWSGIGIFLILTVCFWTYAYLHQRAELTAELRCGPALVAKRDKWRAKVEGEPTASASYEH